VTGAASGLSRAIALGFAARGAAVVCADVDEEGARTVAETADGEATGMYVDVTDRESLEALRDDAQAEYGSYDVLCNILG